ncbi:MAG: hypothetical protein OXI33_00015 [Chloroflexota bacterium]|nr:hypothetical protein [Chloroflexota bacterium]
MSVANTWTGVFDDRGRYSTSDVPYGFLPLRFEPSEMTAVNPAGGSWRAHNTSYRIARGTRWSSSKSGCSSSR